jgi:hypothetical protein
MKLEVGDLHYSTSALWEWNGREWYIVYLARYRAEEANDLILIALNNTKWWKNEL